MRSDVDARDRSSRPRSPVLLVSPQLSMNYSHWISPKTQFYRLSEPFALELGGGLPEVTVAYRSWGTLNAAGDNAIHICHALTGNADADDWWTPLFGTGRTFDADRDFIVCSNVLGSCYGTTGPTSIDPTTGQPYGRNFPAVTVRDMVRLQAELMRGLGVQQLKLAIGGSLGGMQVLEWGRLYPNWVRRLVSIAASGRHSAWCIGMSEAQRQAIYADPNWKDGDYGDRPPEMGLAAARMMAMVSYRTGTSFDRRFGRTVQPDGTFEIASYLRYQGQKLVDRFDANTYVTLTQGMDRHDLGAGDDYDSVLGAIAQPTLVVAIDSDLLYPSWEQEALVQRMPRAELAWLRSPHGHDAFLIDMAALDALVVDFNRRVRDRS